ncbi:MAG TPA: ArsA-related P-loop ATPase [Solirubrobacteraceae bacterium]|jgi:anion-transporting  ArsA/GET3 family ATPase
MTFLDDRELCFVTGKGGVGKTTVALATAMAAARSGRRVVVCELAGQARAAGIFGLDARAPGHEQQLEDGLWATTIDPVLALEEWAARQIGSRRLVGLLTHSNAFAAFVNAAPGARELLAMTKAWELGRDRRWVKGRGSYDLVVVDGPASGHGIGMLRTPHTFAEIARVGPIASQARKVDALLADQARSAFVAVALPSELSVSETLELEARVAAALRRPLDAVVVNGVLPRRFSAEDIERLTARNGAVAPAVVAAARRQHGQGGAQQAQLARLRRHASAPVTTLPLVAAPRLHVDDVRELARRL